MTVLQLIVRISFSSDIMRLATMPRTLGRSSPEFSRKQPYQVVRLPSELRCDGFVPYLHAPCVGFLVEWR